MSLVKVLAGLSRLSRPPAGFRWSHLPHRQARAPRPLPRRVLMTQPRSHLPAQPTLAWQNRNSGGRDLNPPQRTCRLKGLEPTPHGKHKALCKSHSL
ncbi:hypothetical protein [Bellilinea caldifistulae]|uniref:hypothetical protein n=1 Tax=Bellilinea caldifistulae TaxID=360411 RepID=UPI00146FD8EC|nr:hypothetical protein [Bellilinea caldifistulae]